VRQGFGPEVIGRFPPAVYWHLTKDSNIIKIDVPGVQSAKLKLEGNMLSIDAERQIASDVIQFVRTISCPIFGDLQLKDIDHSLEDGMETLIFPRTAEQMERKDANICVEFTNILISGGKARVMAVYSYVF